MGIQIGVQMQITKQNASYKDNVIDEVKGTKFLGMHIDNHMTWKNHVEQFI